MQRFFSLLKISSAAALILSATSLGFLAKPAYADTTGFLTLINSYRQQNNLGTLSEDQNLTNAACWLSADLINGFSHTDSQGRGTFTRLDAFGVFGSRAENIHYNSSTSAASYAFSKWKESPGHNENMLNGVYTRIGIGRVNVNGNWYWVTDFANGTATTMTNQCGTAINPPSTQSPPPNPPVIKVTTPPTSLPTVNIETQPDTDVVIATQSATETNLEVATKSASVTAKIVKFEDNQPKQALSTKALVKSSFLIVNFIGYFILFGFILWRLFHHFRLPIVETEEEIE